MAVWPLQGTCVREDAGRRNIAFKVAGVARHVRRNMRVCHLACVGECARPRNIAFFCVKWLELAMKGSL